MASERKNNGSRYALLCFMCLVAYCAVTDSIYSHRKLFHIYEEFFPGFGLIFLAYFWFPMYFISFCILTRAFKRWSVFLLLLFSIVHFKVLQNYGENILCRVPLFIVGLACAMVAAAFASWMDEQRRLKA